MKPAESNRVASTLRSVVFSIRPTVARAAGLETSIDDLFTPDGVRAWNLGLQLLQDECTQSSGLGPRFVAWTNEEFWSEQLRWRTLHVLAESLESRLAADGPDATWGSSAANTMAFATRMRHGQSVLTADVADRFSKVLIELNCLDATAHWQSLDTLVAALREVLEFPIHDLPDKVPTLVNHMFIEDLAVWLGVRSDNF